MEARVGTSWRCTTTCARIVGTRCPSCREWPGRMRKSRRSRWCPSTAMCGRTARRASSSSSSLKPSTSRLSSCAHRPRKRVRSRRNCCGNCPIARKRWLTGCSARSKRCSCLWCGVPTDTSSGTCRGARRTHSCRRPTLRSGSCARQAWRPRVPRTSRARPTSRACGRQTRAPRRGGRDGCGTTEKALQVCRLGCLGSGGSTRYEASSTSSIRSTGPPVTTTS
mmetsp:Transcript_123317/g.354307  ORF Transcript_123317/g.354307 Transcript_123317/m.354307 type:complete len:223 (+) Transcript_123317:301-969(+)